MAPCGGMHEDALGLSALLVTTSQEMGKCVRELDRGGFKIPVVIGGAAVSAKFAERIARLEDGRSYAGGVFYGRDAFAATRLLNEIRSQGRQKGFSRSAVVMEKSDGEKGQKRARDLEPIEHPQLLEPPFWGTGEMLVWDSQLILDSIDKSDLFKRYWKGAKLGKEEYDRAVSEEFDPSWMRIREKILSGNLLDARGYYGYYPVISDGEHLIVLDPNDFHSELADFTFPRDGRKDGRSLAEYFRPEGDLLAIQVVTLGPAIDQESGELFKSEGKYSEGFYLNSLADLLTEDLANRVTREIRRGLGIDDTGRRFSFGYPGMPGLEEQKKLIEVIAAEDRLGISLTPGHQMVPEHSTIGIFVHHPQAVHV